MLPRPGQSSPPPSRMDSNPHAEPCMVSGDLLSCKPVLMDWQCRSGTGCAVRWSIRDRPCCEQVPPGVLGGLAGLTAQQAVPKDHPCSKLVPKDQPRDRLCRKLFPRDRLCAASWSIFHRVSCCGLTFRIKIRPELNCVCCCRDILERLDRWMGGEEERHLLLRRRGWRT